MRREGFYKTYEENMEHFIKRIKERCDIDFSEEEYDFLCDSFLEKPKKGIVNNVNNFQLKSGTNKSIFLIKIKEKDVLCLYDKNCKRLTTALPIDNLQDYKRTVPRIFKKRNLTEEAIKEYERILEVVEKEYKDLGDVKSNVLYYKTCTYPGLLCAKHFKKPMMRSVWVAVIKKFFDFENRKAIRYV